MKGELQIQFTDELRNNILPFWLRLKDNNHGGFFGRVAGDGTVYPDADKGAVLHSRILWTFSAAYLHFNDPVYLDSAHHAKAFLLDKLWDNQNGGIFWKSDYKGTPVDTKKQIYAQAFAIYGLSQYVRVTDDKEALDKAKELYSLIERYSFDPDRGGYFEAFTGEWLEIQDMRLSDKDANERKTMNTHLHVLEAYTNLYRVWPSADLKKSLMQLLTLFLDIILDSHTGHLKLFFDEQWDCKSDVVSYGHDIESLWLLYEAAVVLGDDAIIKRIESVIPRIANAVTEGLQADGALIYERDPMNGHTDMDRHWWVQAETVVGFSYAARILNDDRYANIATKCWQFIQQYIVDSTQGEWFWSVKADGSVNCSDDKAGLWKCPYHNGRMCMEMIDLMKC